VVSLGQVLVLSHIQEPEGADNGPEEPKKCQLYRKFNRWNTSRSVRAGGGRGIYVRGVGAVGWWLVRSAVWYGGLGDKFMNLLSYVINIIYIYIQ
jgi:hypothetical protein